jgi:hypothetical protein
MLRAEIYDGVDGVDGAQKRSNGSKTRIKTTELSVVDGELGAPKLSVDAVDAPLTENLEK